MEGSNSIKSIQMGLITFFAQTGVGIITIPSLLAREVGHDGWISMLLTGIITIILSMLVIWLLKRYKSKDMYDINALIFGKFIGAGFNFIILLYLFVTTVAGASLFTNFIRITLLQQTPLWILAPFVSLPSIYLVWQGLKSMGRFLYASLFNYIVIIIFLLLLFKEIRFSFLMPLGDAGFTRILYSIKTSFLAYTGFEIIAFLYPHITDKDKALKWHVIAISASIIFFVFVVGISTAIFGENLLSILNLPFYNLSRVYNAPIVERIDLYVIAFWFIPMACSMRCYVFAAFEGLQKVFSLKKTRILYTAYFTIVLILSCIPKDINQVFTFVEITNFAGMGVSVFIILCLLLSFIRKNGVSVK